MSRSRVDLTVEQVEGKGGEALYIIHIATNHHAFTLKRSRTIRRMKDFKFLQSAMDGMHPYSNLPGYCKEKDQNLEHTTQPCFELKL